MKIFPYFAIPILGVMLINAQGSKPVRADGATKLNNRAAELADDGKFAEALVAIDEALLLSPNSPVIIGNKGSILRQMSRSEEALPFLRKSIEINPDSFEARLELGTCLNHLQFWSESARNTLDMSRLNSSGELNDPIEGSMAFRQVQKSDLKPAPDEIRIDGIVQSLKGDQLQLESLLFGLPNGKLARTNSKPKAMKLGDIEPEWPGLGGLPASQLRKGDYVVVFGQQKKDNFTPRRIVVGLRSKAEEKLRGSLFDIAQVEEPDGGENIDIPNLMGVTQFKLKDGSVFASDSAVVLRDGERCALVTTLSSFGWSSRNGVQEVFKTPGLAELKRRIGECTQVLLGQHLDDARVLPTSNPLKVKLLKVYTGGELVTVPVPTDLTIGNLAAERPKRGDKVYVQAWYDGAAWQDEGTVGYSDAKRIFIRFGEEGEAERIPGSVIVNKKGEVVGLHAQGKEPYITAVSVDAIREAMKNS